MRILLLIHNTGHHIDMLYVFFKIHLGTRVVRGPNWNHKSEDNGEGFLGTIVALCHSDRTIQVIWDTGRSGKYRADPNQYDLRLFDNAPTGQSFFLFLK